MDDETNLYYYSIIQVMRQLLYLLWISTILRLKSLEDSDRFKLLVNFFFNLEIYICNIKVILSASVGPYCVSTVHPRMPTWFMLIERSDNWSLSIESVRQNTVCSIWFGLRNVAIVSLIWDFWGPKGPLCDPKTGRKFLFGKKFTLMDLKWVRKEVS